MQAQLTNLKEYCSGCKSPLAMSLPRTNSPLELVQCGECDLHSYADASAELPASLLRGEQAVSGFSPCKHLSYQDHAAFREWLSEQNTPQDNGKLQQEQRRRQRRALVSMPLIVAPLNCQYLPIGNAIEATSLDISASGIAFGVQCDANAFFWMVDFSSMDLVGVQSIVKMVRMEPLDGTSWKVSGPFFSQRHEQDAFFYF